MTKNPKKYIYIYILIPVLILIYFISIVAFPLIYSRNISPTFPQQNPGVILLGNGQEKIKVAVIGDSTAAGQGANSFNDNFSLKYLSKLDNQKYNFEYQNFAISGSRVQDVIDMQIAGLVEFKPDLVLVSIGANDIVTTISDQDYRSQLQQLSTKLANLGVKIIWLNIPDFITSPVLLPPLNTFLSQRTKHFNQILESTIKDNQNFVLVDVYNNAREDFRDPRNMCFGDDGYHPSSQGYEVWSKLIYTANPSLE
jgi:lysophospholipase L1-like esterase